MVTLLQSLHSIASQRGDGLRAELLGIFTPPPAWSESDKSKVTIGEDVADALADSRKLDIRPAEIIRMPLRKRGEPG